MFTALARQASNNVAHAGLLFLFDVFLIYVVLLIFLLIQDSVHLFERHEYKNFQMQVFLIYIDKNFLIIIHYSREQTFNFHPNYISVMMCLERLNNGVRCRHNKHLALITESAVPYLATDQNSGHYSQPTVGPNVSKPAKNKIQKICEIH